MKKRIKSRVKLTRKPKIKTNNGLFLIILFILLAVGGLVYFFIARDTAKEPQAATRDASLWPFDKYSPWNVPIGSKAQYVDTQINMSGKFMDVEGELVMLDKNAPLRTLHAGDGGGEQWWPDAACNTGLTNRGSVHVPDGYVVPNPSSGEDGSLPNRAGGALKSDGKTIQEFQYATRCSSTGPVTAGAFRTTYDIFGKGIPTNASTTSPEGYGAHGGSGLSAVGGALRRWEVSGTDPIRHALKMTVNVGVLSKCNGGYRWPAITADYGYNQSGGQNEYFGPVCEFRMGSLAAIHPSVNCQTFATTPLGKRICQALQDYGAYIVDTGPRTWGAMTILGEYGTASSLRASGDDIEKMFDNLYVVANNGADTPGGCGISDSTCVRRGAGFAPDFGQPISSPVPTVQPVASPSPAPTPPSNPPTGGFEAETMKILEGYQYPEGNVFTDSTASGGKGLSLLSNGFAEGYVSGAFSTITVRARGDQCDGAPSMTVSVDGNAVNTSVVPATAWTDYTANVNAASGTHTVKVSFTNDANPGTCDRNLRLDSVKTAANVPVPSPSPSPKPSPSPTPTLPSPTPTPPVGGISSSTEGEAFSIDSGHIDDRGNNWEKDLASGGLARVFWSNSEMSATYNAGFSSVVLRVAGDYCEGSPNMVVKIDNNQVFSGAVTNLENWSDVTVNYGATAGAHKLSVSFNNDKWNQGVCDRNLWLDKVTFMGSGPTVTTTVIESETFKLNSGYKDPGNNIFSDSTASGGKGFILWSPGSAQTVTNAGFKKAIFRVKADVCDGAPRLTIKIDGQQLYRANFDATGWADITLNFDAAANVNHTIRVELGNDLHRRGVCDRNLRFDKVTLQ